MTTTIPTQIGTTQAGEIEVLRTPPTMADAQLIVQLQLVGAQTGANQGMHVLRTFDSPPTLAQLRKKHAPETPEFRQVTAFLVCWETISTFVRQGILNEALVTDLYWVAGGWQLCAKLVKSARRETGEPKMYENFEWL